MNPKKTVDSVGTPRIVYLEATVREFKKDFTGANRYGVPVEVRAYGRLIGHWFPAGTLPPSLAPGSTRGRSDRPGPDDLHVRNLPPKTDVERVPSVSVSGAPLSARQRERDVWLRRIRRG